MHLVPVRDVAAGLLHLARLDSALNGNIYHVSADDDPDNNFASVEKILSQTLAVGVRKLPLLPVPARLLPLLLRTLGRSDTNVARVYDSRKLRDTGFRPIDSVAAAVREFGATLPEEALSQTRAGGETRSRRRVAGTPSMKL